MKNVGEITVKNRPLAHYLLSLLSFSLSGIDEIHLKSYGSMIGKGIDIANLLARNILVDTFQVRVDNSIEEAKVPCLYGEEKRCKVSSSTVSLEFLRPVAPLIERVVASTRGTESVLSQIDIFELELLLSLLKRHGASTLQLCVENIDYEGTITPFDLELAKLNLVEPEVILGQDIVDPGKAIRDVASLPKGDKTRIESEKRGKKLKNICSASVNALIRASVLRPELESLQFHVSQWDDIILGLDTNLFYQCAPTVYILDSLMKIPSGDFIDTPDWVTLVVSKVSVAEIEDRAHRGARTWDKRESLRAIQEMMLLNRSKDLEGISLFLVGSVPPEIEFSVPGTTTMRDFLIREHFRTFLKQLDFYKGSYFATADFDNATLAEAEGLASLYVAKPKLSEARHRLPPGQTSVSELLYELNVAFEPLVVNGEGVKLRLHSDWEGKTLENWENLELQLEWVEDQAGLKSRFEELKTEGSIADMIKACHDLGYRFVKWVK